MKRIVAVGDNVVDCYPASATMYPGGNCLNVAIFARRCGADTAYVGAIGEDAAGAAIRAALAAEGVRTERLRIVAGPTAYCRIGHGPSGDRVFLDWDLAVSMFTPDAGDLAYVADFDAVHVGQSSGLDDHVGAFAARARLSYDFSTRRDAGHRARIAPLCFLASVSAGGLPPAEVDALLEEMIGHGARYCLATRGEAGAILASAEGRLEQPAAPARVVDTLGAGDAFIATTLVGLLAGEDPRLVLADAARRAAETCSHFGATGHPAPLALARPGGETAIAP